MSPAILKIFYFVQLAMQYAPEARKVADNARALFAMWFSEGLITVEQQAKLYEWAENHEAETLAGIVPPEFLVEPDPT